MARQKNISLNAFSMESYGIPYGYSPVLVATPQVLRYSCLLSCWTCASCLCSAVAMQGLKLLAFCFVMKKQLF